ncbi:hypothetical protein ScPMuIL_018300 [Solemya velum]
MSRGSGKNRKTPTDCKEDLLEDVADTSLSGSSSFEGFEPHRARLTIPGSELTGSWVPRHDDVNQYIQVKFNNTKLITGISTKGAIAYDRRLTSYSVLHSTDGTSWITVVDTDGNDKIFNGNVDQDSLVKHEFTQHFQAKYVRINPRGWHNWPAMRFGVSGCDLVCM